MTKKSDTIRLRHMLDATEKARSFVQGQTRKDLDRDEKLALALVRLVDDLPALSRELRSALKEETGADQEALWK